LSFVLPRSAVPTGTYIPYHNLARPVIVVALSVTAVHTKHILALSITFVWVVSPISLQTLTPRTETTILPRMPIFKIPIWIPARPVYLKKRHTRCVTRIQR
jgi:hypothetical protein